MDDRPQDDNEIDEAGDEGIIGEIEAVEAGEPAREERPDRAPGRWRRRSIVIGCLLALLGGIIGGGVAVIVGLGPVDEPEHAAEVAPDTIPANRLIFSPTPHRPTATPDIIAAETELVYCFYEMGRLPAGAELVGEWWLDGEPLGDLPVQNLQRDEEVEHARGRFELRSPPEDGSIGFRPGIYEVEVTSPHHPEVSARASFVVLPRAARILQGGGEPEGPPVIRSLRTARDVTDDGEPIDATTVFPPNVGRIYAVFEYGGITPGAVLTARWHIADTEIERARSEVAIPAARGWAQVSLTTGPSDLLPPGPYRVSIHLGDETDPLASVGFNIEGEDG